MATSSLFFYKSINPSPKVRGSVLQNNQRKPHTQLISQLTITNANEVILVLRV